MLLKLEEATLTSQGQISVPKMVRERMGLSKGDKILFYEDNKGNILIKEAEIPIELSRNDWKLFLERTEREAVKRVRGKTAALKHLDRLANRK